MRVFGLAVLMFIAAFFGFTNVAPEVAVLSRVILVVLAIMLVVSFLADASTRTENFPVE